MERYMVKTEEEMRTVSCFMVCFTFPVRLGASFN